MAKKVTKHNLLQPTICKFFRDIGSAVTDALNRRVKTVKNLASDNPKYILVLYSDSEKITSVPVE